MRLEDAIDAVRPSVVQITYTIRNLPAERRTELGLTDEEVFSKPIGTGFFVSTDGLIVTAEHVLQGAAQLRKDVPEGAHHIGVGMAYPNTATKPVQVRGTFHVVPFRIVDTDPVHDLALLRPKVNPFAGEIRTRMKLEGEWMEPLYGVPDFFVDRPRDGMPIAVSGYPLQSAVMLTTSGIIASSWAVDVHSAVSPELAEAQGTLVSVQGSLVSDSYLADIEVNPGNSGGPAYSAEGAEVIGVCVATRVTAVLDHRGEPAKVGNVLLHASASLGIVVPARYVRELLERNGVPEEPQG